jgi:hypothetical protein
MSMKCSSAVCVISPSKVVWCCVCSIRTPPTRINVAKIISHVFYIVTCIVNHTYIDLSKSFETSSIERQLIAVREFMRCAWEQGISPLSIPSGVTASVV